MTKIKANQIGEERPDQAVGAFIICETTGRALLQLRGRTSDTPLTWGTFGGGVDEGENLEMALKRELHEECNFTGNLKLVPLYRFVSDDKTFEYYTFIGLVEEEFAPITNHETEDYRWFDATNKKAYPTPLHPGLEDLLLMPRNWKKIQQYTPTSMVISAKRR